VDDKWRKDTLPDDSWKFSLIPCFTPSPPLITVLPSLTLDIELPKELATTEPADKGTFPEISFGLLWFPNL